MPKSVSEEQTLRPSSRSELVEFAHSANFRVWELRIFMSCADGAQHDCRADAVALGAGHTSHGRLLRKIKRKQTLRVCGTRYCPARAAQGGDQLRPQVPSLRVPLAIQAVLLSSPKRLRQRSFTPLTYSAVLVGEQQASRGLDLNKFSAN